MFTNNSFWLLCMKIYETFSCDQSLFAGNLFRNIYRTLPSITTCNSLIIQFLELNHQTTYIYELIVVVRICIEPAKLFWRTDCNKEFVHSMQKFYKQHLKVNIMTLVHWFLILLNITPWHNFSLHIFLVIYITINFINLVFKNLFYEP